MITDHWSRKDAAPIKEGNSCEKEVLESHNGG